MRLRQWRPLMKEKLSQQPASKPVHILAEKLSGQCQDQMVEAHNSSGYSKTQDKRKKYSAVSTKQNPQKQGEDEFQRESLGERVKAPHTQ